MNNIDREGLNRLKERSFILGAAYQFGRDRFAYSNMITLVLPAILSSVVAIFAAISNPPDWFMIGRIPLESILAGTAAILVTIHKVLNCEEYQAECLRLSNVFKSIAQEAEIAIHSSTDSNSELTRLTDSFSHELKSAQATVPKSCMVKARKYAVDENYL
jgi:hypothetical protein